MLLILLFTAGAWAQDLGVLASPFTDEQRLRGFYQHHRDAKEFDQDRLSGLDEVKEDRAAWDEMMRKSMPRFRQEKAQEAAPLDEKSAAYKRKLRDRQEEWLYMEELRERYVKARNAAAASKRRTVKLSEEQEFDLHMDWKPVAQKNRALYSNDKKFSFHAAQADSNPSNIYEPPPPPMPPPPPPPGDYYEPEIPPPPPPFDPGGMDNFPPPPPIFDEPEF
jgi:hypothetical protein